MFFVCHVILPLIEAADSLKWIVYRVIGQPLLEGGSHESLTLQPNGVAFIENMSGLSIRQRERWKLYFAGFVIVS